ncbi:MAG: hypothetical protein ACYTFI_28555, partial [Planctomycetota bacterium]
MRTKMMARACAALIGHQTRTGMLIVAVAIAIHALPAVGAGVPAQLPDPDGKPADMSKPVQVFILMGQSNMVGAGKTAGLKAATQKGLYPYLVDDAGNWTVRKDVRNVFVMCSGASPWKTYLNDWLSPGTSGRSFGPE